MERETTVFIMRHSVLVMFFVILLVLFCCLSCTANLWYKYAFPDNKGGISSLARGFLQFSVLGKHFNQVNKSISQRKKRMNCGLRSAIFLSQKRKKSLNTIKIVHQVFVFVIIATLG